MNDQSVIHSSIIYVAKATKSKLALIKFCLFWCLCIYTYTEEHLSNSYRIKNIWFPVLSLHNIVLPGYASQVAVVIVFRIISKQFSLYSNALPPPQTVLGSVSCTVSRHTLGIIFLSSFSWSTSLSCICGNRVRNKLWRMIVPCATFVAFKGSSWIVLRRHLQRWTVIPKAFSTTLRAIENL